MTRIIATPTGAIEAPSVWEAADLERNWYLIPARLHRIPGDRYACHINHNGAPLCGAILSEPYEESKIKCAYQLCPDCEKWTGAELVQAGLLDDLEYDSDGRRYNGVAVA